jgi:menaquinol-cytochrome c reductase iron-sulfur subunit
MAENTPDAIGRRTFLAWLAGGLTGLWAAFLGVPMLGALLLKPPAAAASDFVEVGSVADLKPEEPVAMSFTDTAVDGYVHQVVERSVWVVKSASGQITAFTPVCPHLGCQYSWDAAAQHFVCPCHNSVFDVNGKLLSGPASRGLDALPSQVQDGALSVKWQSYELSTPQKIQIG